MARERAKEAIDLDIEQHVNEERRQLEIREEAAGVPLAERSVRKTYREHYLRQRIDHFDYKFRVSNHSQNRTLNLFAYS